MMGGMVLTGGSSLSLSTWPRWVLVPAVLVGLMVAQYKAWRDMLNERDNALGELERLRVVYRKGAIGQGDTASCGHPNPVWWVESRLWNEVITGDPNEEGTGVLCPSCFSDRADTHFVGSGWRITGWQLVPDLRRVDGRHRTLGEGL